MFALYGIYVEKQFAFVFKEFLALLLDTLHEELRAESATKLISLSLEGGAISNPLVEDSSVNMASKIGARRLPENNGSTDDKR